MTIERHYKTTELAELLSVHPETIRRAAARGEIESTRIGLDRIYPESAVKRWLDSKREGAGRVVSLPRRRETRASTTTRRSR